MHLRAQLTYPQDEWDSQFQGLDPGNPNWETAGISSSTNDPEAFRV